MIKKVISLIAAVCIVEVSAAQDVIVKKDGSTILSKVLEVNSSDVRYKKFSNLNGPTYTINVSELLSINYENGEKDEFKGTTASNNSQLSVNDSNSPQLVEKAADLRNPEIIALYNHDCQPEGKKIFEDDDKPAKLGYLIYWVSPSSVMSNDEIEMSFVKQIWEDNRDYSDYYAIVLKNKTNNFIYVDLANSFRNCSNGDVRCYYDTDQTTVSQGNSSGGSVGLGAVAGALGVGGVVGQLASGVAVGGGSTGSVSTTYTSQRIISIPPRGQRNLTDFKRVKVKGDTYKTVSEAEDFDVLKTGLKGKINAGVHFFEESNSPFTIDYNITYSTSDVFSTYSIIHSKLFLREIIGSKYSNKHIKTTGWQLNARSHIEKYVSGVTNNSLIGIKDEF